MASYLAQVTLQHTDAADSADAVNTFHFRKALVTDNFTFIQEMVEDFYTRIHDPQTLAVSSFLSPRIRRDVPAIIKIYDDNALDPGGPIHEGTFPLLPAESSTPLIEEVALCASFHAEPVLGARRQSTSGRVYLGPLNGRAQNSNDNGRPAADFMAVVIAAMTELHAASTGGGAGGHDWVVFSPTLQDRLSWTAEPDFPVVGGHVDNAFDTQRRRGLDPSSRSTWGT